MNTIEQYKAQSELGKVSATGGELANQQASMAVFHIYRQEKAANTCKAQRRALRRFGSFLSAQYGEQLPADALYAEPQTWGVVTWGYVTAYRAFLISEGVRIATINQHLSVIRVYAAMAFQAGFVSSDEERRISKVSGVTGTKAKANVNASRKISEAAKTVNTLSKAEVRKLERALMRVDTPTGRRDMLLFEMLFRHGMRASEVLILTHSSFDLNSCQVTFERPKVGHVGDDAARHDLESKTIERLKAYQSEIADDGPLWQSSKRGGGLSGRPLSRASLDRAIKKWGERVGIKKLSAHDGRHSIATMWANRSGMTPQKLLSFFGWASILTAQRYIQRAEIGNKGMRGAF